MLNKHSCRVLSFALSALLLASILPISAIGAETKRPDYEVGEIAHDIWSSHGRSPFAQEYYVEADGQYKGQYFFYDGCAICIGEKGQYLIDVRGKAISKYYNSIAGFHYGLAIATVNIAGSYDVDHYEALRPDGTIAFEIPVQKTVNGATYNLVNYEKQYNDGLLLLQYFLASSVNENLKENPEKFSVYVDTDNNIVLNDYEAQKKLKSFYGGTIKYNEDYELITYSGLQFSEGLTFGNVTRVNKSENSYRVNAQCIINKKGEIVAMVENEYGPTIDVGNDSFSNGWLVSKYADVMLNSIGSVSLAVDSGFVPQGFNLADGRASIGGHYLYLINDEMIRSTRYNDNSTNSIAFVNVNDTKSVVKITSKAYEYGKSTTNEYYSEGFLGAVSDNGKYGFVDKKGNWVIEAKYDAVGYFSEGLAPVVYNGKLGYIGVSGNIVIPFQYDGDLRTANFHTGYATVEIGKYVSDVKATVLKNPLTASGTTPIPAPVPNLPQYNGLVKDGKAVYNTALAAEGIDNATAAYWQYFNNGQMFKDNGYYDFVYMVDGLVDNVRYGKGVNFDFLNGGGSTNAVFCLKDISVDGKSKTMVNISVRGTEQLTDWVKDFTVYSLTDSAEQVFYTHYGFEIGKKQIVENEGNVYFPTLKKHLSDIIDSAKSADSEYLIFVNGHSLGAAVTNMYVTDLYNRQVNINNLVGYGYATPKPFALGYSSAPTIYPVFNIINNDDLVPKVGANGFGFLAMRMGTDLVYYPDEAFRKANNREDIINRGSLFEQIKDSIVTGGVSSTLALLDNASGFLRYMHEQATYKIITKQGKFGKGLPSTWAAETIKTAQQLGLATAELDANYQTSTTRAEFCRAAVNFLRAYGYDVDNVSQKTFADTSDRDIGVAAALGITSGTDTGKNLFSPDSTLTREQAATMLRNVMNVIGKPAPASGVAWTDAKDISSWAKEASDVMYSAKIMGGTSTTELVFSPKTPYTHEQSIITLVNLWEYVK
ncbi:hypothetical protein FACS1894202_11710 [Clostridia bacterium]|nr:hypothetical protein FACS1894202_11710 [Clostridia bacterium]